MTLHRMKATTMSGPGLLDPTARDRARGVHVNRPPRQFAGAFDRDLA